MVGAGPAPRVSRLAPCPEPAPGGPAALPASGGDRLGPPRAGATRLRWLLGGVALAGLTACETHEPTLTLEAMAVREPPLVVGPLRHQRSASAVEDTFAVFRAADLVLVPDGILVGDTGNDRLVLFDPTLRPLRTIGRSGEGPGELRQPFRVRANATHLVVNELGNPRFSFFRLDGTFSHTVPRNAMYGWFAVAADATLFMGAPDGDRYLLRTGPDGDTVSIAQIPIGVAAFASSATRLTRWREDLVAITVGDTLHVFDNEVGVLVKYDRDGTARLARALPDGLRRSVIDHRRSAIESLESRGQRVLSAPLASHLSVTASGELYLHISDGRSIGLLIEPRGYRARRVVARDTTAEWRALRETTAAVMRDSTLFAIGRHGLAAYSLPVGGWGPD